MQTIRLLDSDAWLNIIKDRPAAPDLSANDVKGVQEYVADMFEWTFSVSMGTQGLTADKNVSDKIFQNLGR